MKIFGGWIPALRFQRYEVTDDGFPIVEGLGGEPSGYETDALIFEWELIDFLYILFTTNIREIEGEDEDLDS